ncbi:Fc.00g080220.m01.CDS01 [Cosmosporella sp. VM-42]
MSSYLLYAGQWEIAESILSGYKRPIEAKHLQALDLLRGIVATYIGSSQLDRASRVCKVVIQGYKKFGTEYASRYDESLGLLSNVYEKTGRGVEAEAIRNSLTSQHCWELPDDCKLFARDFLEISQNMSSVITKQQDASSQKSVQSNTKFQKTISSGTNSMENAPIVSAPIPHNTDSVEITPSILDDKTCFSKKVRWNVDNPPSFEISPNNKYLVVWEPDPDIARGLDSLPSGALITRLMTDDTSVKRPIWAFSSDGKYLATTESRQHELDPTKILESVRVYQKSSTSRWTCVRTFEDTGADFASFLPDQPMLVIARGTETRLLDGHYVTLDGIIYVATVVEMGGDIVSGAEIWEFLTNPDGTSGSNLLSSYTSVLAEG